MEIVPVVDGAVPAENKPGGGGVTRFVLLLALLIGGSTDSSSSTSATVFLYRQSFCLCPPLSAVTTVALELRAALVFTFVLSFAFVLALLAFAVFAFLALVTVHSVDFHW